MSPQPLPPKKVVALALIEQSTVHLHLDPRASGVVVPAWFKQQPQLVLQIGMNMAVPIPDLYFDDEKMSCTLSFNRSPFFCIVPWDAVFAMVGDDGRGMVWPESLPPEVAKARTAPREATPEERKLRAVHSEKEEAAAPKKTAKKSAAKKSAKTDKSVKKSAPKKAASGKTRNEKPENAKSASAKKKSAKKPAKSTKKSPKQSPAKAKEKTKDTDARSTKPEARIVRLPSESRRADDPPRAAQANKPQEQASRGNAKAGNKPKRELPPYLRVVK
jgi:stringent starvation protein B